MLSLAFLTARTRVGSFVGALLAFNMISNQMVQLILRLSQLWQDLLAARADRLRGDR